jgi:hypothetical protein
LTAGVREIGERPFGVDGILNGHAPVGDGNRDFSEIGAENRAVR